MSQPSFALDTLTSLTKPTKNNRKKLVFISVIEMEQLKRSIYQLLKDTVCAS